MRDRTTRPAAVRARRCGGRAAITAATALGALAGGGVAHAASDDAVLAAAAKDSGKPAGELRIADRTTMRHAVSGRTVHIAKVLDRSGLAYQVAFDERDRQVDAAALERQEHAARRARYGKLDAALAERLESSDVSSTTKLPVSIWVAGTPDVRRTGDLSADLARVQAATSQQRSSLMGALRGMGADPREPTYGPAVFARLTPGQIKRLQARSDVDAVYTNASYGLTADDASTTNRFHYVWQSGNLGAGPSSRPVVHEPDGVSDTNPFLNNGTHPVTFFCSAIIASSPCSVGKNFGTTPSTNHATRVAGQIASTHPRARGVAPNAQMILSANTQDFSDAKLVAANEWARGNGGDPTNMSWGTTCPDGGQSFMQRYVDWAVRNLFQTFTISSGNDHPNCPGNLRVSAPGTAWSAITVGAINDNNTGFATGDTVSSFSRHIDPVSGGNNGQTKPEVVAVGENTLTTDVGTPTVDGIAGTSFSAPLVAGQVTSMLARQPGQNQWPETNKAAVLASAWRDVDTSGSDKDGLGNVLMNHSDETYRLARFHNIADSTGGPVEVADFPITDPDGRKALERTATFTAGQAVRAVLAWDAESAGGDDDGVYRLGADIDLQVVRPDGTVVCNGASIPNAWESCSFRAPVTGTYRLRARLISSEPGWTGTFMGMAWSTRFIPNICTAPARTFPSTGGSITASNQNGPTYFDSYSGWVPSQTGREQVFIYNNTATRNITFSDTSATMDLHAVRIASCSADPITPTVLTNHSSSITLVNATAGRYYFIADSANGAVASATYTLTPGAPTG